LLIASIFNGGCLSLQELPLYSLLWQQSVSRQSRQRWLTRWRVWERS